MNTLQTIKKDQVQARKDRNKIKATFLTTLYSEAANVGLNDGKRESTDQEVTAVLKKFIKNIELTITAYDGTPTALLAEKAWTNSYLPQQLDEDQLQNAIEMIIGGLHNPTLRDMGTIMKEMKSMYSGQYDGGIASKLIKSMLA